MQDADLFLQELLGEEGGSRDVRTLQLPASTSSRRGDLKKSMTNIASECRSANILRDHALILPDDATPKPDGIFGKDKMIGRRLSQEEEIWLPEPSRTGLMASLVLGIQPS